MSEEVEARQGEEAQSQQDEGPKRAVVISPKARVVFRRKSTGAEEVVMTGRDVFSVIDAVGSRIESTKDKEEFEDTVVSVLSVEDPDKSDPLPEGGKRWEGPYGVGNVEVDGLPLSDAMTELAKAVIPNDAAVRGVERLAEQLFLRSRLDGFVFIGTFDGQPAVIPLISSFRERTEECFAMLYRQLHIQAENLKAWTSKTFPDLKVNWTGQDGRNQNQGQGQGGRPSGLVLPDGRPVESRSAHGKPSCGPSCRRG